MADLGRQRLGGQKDDGIVRSYAQARRRDIPVEMAVYSAAA